MGDSFGKNITDLFYTISPVIRTIPKRFRKKIYRLFCTNKVNHNEKINKTTVRYQNIISKILENYYGNDWDNAINHVFYSLSKLSKKKYINSDGDFFEQLINIINFLHEKIKVNQIFNTLNSSGLKRFYNETIGMKIKYLAHNGFSCRHHALLFKHILDEIESRTKLGISSYFLLKKQTDLIMLDSLFLLTEKTI